MADGGFLEVQSDGKINETEIDITF